VEPGAGGVFYLDRRGGTGCPVQSPLSFPRRPRRVRVGCPPATCGHRGNSNAAVNLGLVYLPESGVADLA
jgi:hypothetical protein